MTADEQPNQSSNGASPNGAGTDDDLIDRLTGPYADTLRRHKAEGFDGAKYLAEIEAVAATWPE
jgi:hypothetical protein